MMLLFLFSCPVCFAQIDSLVSPSFQITLRNGNIIRGRIISSEKNFLNFLSVTNDSIKIERNSIDEIINTELLPKTTKFETEIVDSSVIIEFEDNTLSRMVIFPTARKLDAFHGYVQLNELFFPFAAIGLGNFLTLGGGVSLIPAATEQIVYFSPKVTPFEYKSLSLAAGMFVATFTNKVSTTMNFFENFNVAYAMTTIGDRDKSVTFGLGYNISSHSSEHKPLLIFGGDLRIGHGIKIIIENWFPPDSKNFISFIGFRFLGKHFNGDVTLIRVLGPNSGKQGLVPWFNITYNFDFSKKE